MLYLQDPLKRTDIVTGSVECGTELTLFSTQIIVRCNKLIIDFNKRSLKQLVSAREKKMLLIPNVSHLFEELGALEKVAKNSIEWFNQYV